MCACAVIAGRCRCTSITGTRRCLRIQGIVPFVTHGRGLRALWFCHIDYALRRTFNYLSGIPGLRVANVGVLRDYGSAAR
jgi:hypothetical protein